MHDISVNAIRGHYMGQPVRIVAGSSDAGNAQIRNIRFRDLHTNCAGNIEIKGAPGTRPTGITFDDCSFETVKRPFPGKPEKMPSAFLDLAHADNLHFRNCTLRWGGIEPEWRKTSMIEDVNGLDFEKSSFPELPR